MNLDVKTLDLARDAWRTGDHAQVQRQPITELTLGAALEAACWGIVSERAVQELLDGWADRSEALRQALRALRDQPIADVPAHHAAPLFELRKCPTDAELKNAGDAGVDWLYFLDRFRRSAVNHLNVSSRRAMMLSGALCEMVDNVVQHAGLGAAPTAIVAYSVKAPCFEVAVADLGRGVLASLHENERHRTLTTDAAALIAACTQNASRREHHDGTGFAELLRALSDLDGNVTFRSGAARMTLDGRGLGARQYTTSNCPRLLGFQLSARGNPSASSWMA